MEDFVVESGLYQNTTLHRFSLSYMYVQTFRVIGTGKVSSISRQSLLEKNGEKLLTMRRRFIEISDITVTI